MIRWLLKGFFAFFIIFFLPHKVLAQALVVDSAKWGEIDINASESLAQSIESILGDTAKFESLFEMSESSWLRKLSRSVGRLEVLSGSGYSVCTAFFVNKNHIVTNYHCIPGRNGGIVTEARIVMGYYRKGLAENIRVYQVNVLPVSSDNALDYSVLETYGDGGREWGALEVAFRKPEENEPLMIVHHPGGQEKKITRSGCLAGPISDFSESTLLHRCDTLPGSSGSPVLDLQGKVVALHFGGTPLKGPGAYNSATLISSISAKTNLISSEGVGTNTTAPMDNQVSRPAAQKLQFPENANVKIFDATSDETGSSAIYQYLLSNSNIRDISVDINWLRKWNMIHTKMYYLNDIGKIIANELEEIIPGHQYILDYYNQPSARIFNDVPPNRVNDVVIGIDDNRDLVIFAADDIKHLK